MSHDVGQQRWYCSACKERHFNSTWTFCAESGHMVHISTPSDTESPILRSNPTTRSVWFIVYLLTNAFPRGVKSTCLVSRPSVNPSISPLHPIIGLNTTTTRSVPCIKRAAAILSFYYAMQLDAASTNWRHATAQGHGIITRELVELVINWIQIWRIWRP